MGSGKEEKVMDEVWRGVQGSRVEIAILRDVGIFEPSLTDHYKRALIKHRVSTFWDQL